MCDMFSQSNFIKRYIKASTFKALVHVVRHHVPDQPALLSKIVYFLPLLDFGTIRAKLIHSFDVMEAVNAHFTHSK